MNRILIVSAILFLLTLFLGNTVLAQGKTDLYLVAFDLNKDPALQKIRPLRISANTSYNNQPFYLKSGKGILYSSEIDGQTEIYRYDVATGKNQRLTRNDISEYSPTPMPDGNHFSTVQLYVTPGPDKGKQPLVYYPMGGGSANVIYSGEKKIGYHAWIDRHRLALFVLGNPHTLQLFDRRSGQFKTIAKGIGRAIHKVPGRAAVSYSTENNDGALIVIYDPGPMGEMGRIPLKERGDYFNWGSDGKLYTVSDAVLYYWSKENRWKALLDVKPLGLKTVSRFAVSPLNDSITVVTSRGR